MVVLRGQRRGQEPDVRGELLALAAVITLGTLQVCLVWPIICRLLG